MIIRLTNKTTMANTPFKLRSGNKSSFKQLGSSPAKDLGHGGHPGMSRAEAAKRTHGGKMSKKDLVARQKADVNYWEMSKEDAKKRDDDLVKRREIRDEEGSGGKGKKLAKDVIKTIKKIKVKKKVKKKVRKKVRNKDTSPKKPVIKDPLLEETLDYKEDMKKKKEKDLNSNTPKNKTKEKKSTQTKEEVENMPKGA